MRDSLTTYDTFIFDEMMVHPLFFTHPRVKKIAIIEPAGSGILTEIAKHADVKVFQGEATDWLNEVPPAPFDAIILPDNSLLTAALCQQYASILTPDGIFVCEAGSLFDLTCLQSICHVLHEGGFRDLQILHFPQPGFLSGMRVAIMGMKHGPFKRIRERDIFNKLFATRYYNFDIHKAALVMPEFMREELILP
jgi:spermidine synthase